MAARSTLVTRLKYELRDLEERIRLSQDKTARLNLEKKELNKVIDGLETSLKKTNASVSTMPTRRAPSPATAS